MMRIIGLAGGDAGLNLDFHSIRHHGADAPLDDNCVPSRAQATRSVLAFFAQDHASTEMVYANADVTKDEAAREILAFADHWKTTTGADPGLLVFDSRLTTYKVLDELGARRVDWLTLRQRGKTVLARLAALPDSAWKSVRIDRAGRYRHPQLHEDTVALKGIAAPVRQIAVRNIGRDQPTLLITNDHTAKAKDLFARHAERMLIANELASCIGGFHLDALSSGLALNVDVDTTLTVIAGNLYRLLARSLKRYEHMTPERIHGHFVDTTGTLRVAHDHVTVDLTTRTFTPVLLQAGYAERDLPIPWWNQRRLRLPSTDGIDFPVPPPHRHLSRIFRGKIGLLAWTCGWVARSSHLPPPGSGRSTETSRARACVTALTPACPGSHLAHRPHTHNVSRKPLPTASLYDTIQTCVRTRSRVRRSRRSTTTPSSTWPNTRWPR
ncbi:MAG: hypothetical protein ACRDYX_20435 [Egibacteraceae bacterium]